MSTQLSRGERLAQADDVIDNSGTLAAMDEQVERLDRAYRARAAAAPA
jgi:dephospho-CoA kinase